MAFNVEQCVLVEFLAVCHVILSLPHWARWANTSPE